MVLCLQSGLFVLGSVVGGSGPDRLMECQRLSGAYHDLIDRAKLKAFGDIIVAPTAREGIINLILVCRRFLLAFCFVSRVHVVCCWAVFHFAGCPPHVVCWCSPRVLAL